MRACPPSASKITGACSKLFTMSASSRAGMRATPSSWTWTSSRRRAETSKSVVARTSSLPEAFIRTPVSAGIPGREETARCTVCRASEKTSRSHLNFIPTSSRPSFFCGGLEPRSSSAFWHVEIHQHPSVTAGSDIVAGVEISGSGRGAAGDVAVRAQPIPRSLVVVSPTSRTPARPRPDPLGQVLDLPVGAPPGRHEALDLLDAVQDRRVIAPEVLSDLDQGESGQLAKQVHGHMTGGGERAGPALGDEIVGFEPEVRRGLLHDDHSWALLAGLGDQILQGPFREIEVHSLAGQRAERGHTEERALQFTDVVLELRGDEVQNVVGDRQAIAHHLELEDGDTSLQIGRLHVHHQARTEPAAKSLLDPPELLGRTVGRAHV